MHTGTFEVGDKVRITKVPPKFRKGLLGLVGKIVEYNGSDNYIKVYIPNFGEFHFTQFEITHVKPVITNFFNLSSDVN